MTFEWLWVAVFGWPGPLMALWLAVVGLLSRRPAWLVGAAVAVLPFSVYLAGHPGARWGILLPALPLAGAFALGSRASERHDS